jgi:hypothetical protein
MIEIGKRVVYIPDHAFGSRVHPDCEYGVVTKIGTDGSYFVKFDGENISKSCRSSSLREV